MFFPNSDNQEPHQANRASREGGREGGWVDWTGQAAMAEGNVQNKLNSETPRDLHLNPYSQPCVRKRFSPCLFLSQRKNHTYQKFSKKKKHPRKITSSKLLTKFCFCACVDALKATVGNSLRRYFNHLSTISLGTRSEE